MCNPGYNSESEKWFLLNFIPASTGRKVRVAKDLIQTFNKVNLCNLEIFAPFFKTVKSIRGKYATSFSPLIFHYVFVKGNLSHLKKLCGANTGFSFVLARGQKERYAYISESEMADFKRIARFYENEIPVYNIDNINLIEGDKVEIVKGELPGLKGYYFPNPKSKQGNICISVTGNLATVIYNVKAEFLRVLEFSKISTRSYDYIDAILPPLFKCFRKLKAKEKIEENELEELSIFIRRYGEVKGLGKKTTAKLYAILSACCFITGDVKKELKYKSLLEKFREFISLPQTNSLIILLETLIQYFHTGNKNKISDTEKSNRLLVGLGLLNNIEKHSSSLTRLREEYSFHLQD